MKYRLTTISIQLYLVGWWTWLSQSSLPGKSRIYFSIVVVSHLQSCTNATVGLARVKVASWLVRGWIEADWLGRGAGGRWRDGLGNKMRLHLSTLSYYRHLTTHCMCSYLCVYTEPPVTVLLIKALTCACVWMNVWVYVFVWVCARLCECCGASTADGHM